MISAATPRVKDVPKGSIWKETEVEDRQRHPRYQAKGLREKQKVQAQYEVRNIQNQAQIREFRDFPGSPAVSTQKKNNKKPEIECKPSDGPCLALHCSHGIENYPGSCLCTAIRVFLVDSVAAKSCFKKKANYPPIILL